MPASNFTAHDLRHHIDRLPRLRLAHLPTPLEHLPRFSEALGGPRILIKRDDCTGLAFGGNKARHNEFVLADALDQGVDMLVWGAGVQSNNCRQTAAACARLGLGCHLVLSRDSHDVEVQGNLLLDHLLGATVEFIDDPMGPQMSARIDQVADRFRDQGRKVYCSSDHERVRPRAAVSYCVCMAEMVEQLAAMSVEPAAIYVSSGGSTGAGLALGRVALGVECPLRIILPIRWPWDELEGIREIANAVAGRLELSVQVEPSDLEVSGDYVGPAYGQATPQGMQAISLLARTEGLLLDPAYTGKAMAGLIADVRQGKFKADDAVVFVHTGGTPALFAYRDELMAMIGPRR